MWPNPQETTDLVTFTEEILIGKLHFLRSFSKNKCIDKICSFQPSKHFIAFKTAPQVFLHSFALYHRLIYNFRYHSWVPSHPNLTFNLIWTAHSRDQNSYGQCNHSWYNNSFLIDFFSILQKLPPRKTALNPNFNVNPKPNATP